MSQPKDQIRYAVIGGGDDELSVFSELQKNPAIKIIGIYDPEPAAIGLEIAEVLGIPTYSDDTFVQMFSSADFVLLPQMTTRFRREIELLAEKNVTLVSASEALRMILKPKESSEEGKPPRGAESAPDLWSHSIEETLESLNRVMDREELLKWLLEIAVRAVGASSGSILLVSGNGQELFVGFAHGLSERVVRTTRIRMGEGIAGSVAHDRQPRLITERLDRPLYGSQRERMQIESSIVMPLVHRGEVLGVLNVSTNQGEPSLEEEHLEILKRLGRRMAAVLHRSRALMSSFDKAKENSLRDFLEKLGSASGEFHEKFARLSHFFTDLVAAESVALYVTTEDGGWFVLAGSDHHAPADPTTQRFRALRGSVARCFLEQRPVLLTEPKEEGEEISRLYFPITYQRPLGVAVIEFLGAQAREQFERTGAPLLIQIGAFLLEEIKELSVTNQFQGLNLLARLAPAVLQFPLGDDLWREVLRRGVEIVNAERGTLRLERGKETLRGPFYHGFARGPVEEWKALDERAVRTYASRNKILSLSRIDPDDEEEDLGEGYRSLALLPISAGTNDRVTFLAYNKAPRSPLDSCVFTRFDVKLLERFGETIGPILTRPEPGPGEVEDWHQVLAQNRARFLATLEQETGRAERYHLGYVLTRVRIPGFSELFRDNLPILLTEIRRLSGVMERLVRRSDHFEWIEIDGFVILSLERRERVKPLERRVIARLNSTLRSIGKEFGKDLHIETGHARYPADGTDASELLEKSYKSLKKYEL